MQRGVAAYFVQGSEWCTYYPKFTGYTDYGMFDEVYTFESPGNYYSILTLTFGATSGTSSPTSDVDPDSFPTS
ncbi:MAG: hypothetical protein KDB06_15080 [Ilumatobacter sp.]|nr:hypothetical protein [Ilumatobacter sp.]